MIRGRFVNINGIQRPFINAFFVFPTLNNQMMEVELLVDTGADGTRLGPGDAVRMERELGIDLTSLAQAEPSIGVGGQAPTRTITALLLLDGLAMPLILHILEPETFPLLPLPSLLGRDILSAFALFMEQRTSRVFLLEPDEVNALALPL